MKLIEFNYFWLSNEKNKTKEMISIYNFSNWFSTNKLIEIRISFEKYGKKCFFFISIGYWQIKMNEWKKEIQLHHRTAINNIFFHNLAYCLNDNSGIEQKLFHFSIQLFLEWNWILKCQMHSVAFLIDRNEQILHFICTEKQKNNRENVQYEK